MKTLNINFNQQITYDKFLAAYDRAKIGKGRRREIANFTLDLENNLAILMKDIKNGTYAPGAYRRFKIYEPKERDIMALPFRDRIAQQWFVEEFIKPYFVPRFTWHSYACVEDHGTHSAHQALHQMLRRTKRQYPDAHVIKMDISKFFYSIDKYILEAMLRKYIRNQKLLDLCRIFIYDTPDAKGIPIGNYTSQFFANIYLNELDQYIKRQLKVHYYIRYMDDFVSVLPDKKTADQTWRQIEQFVEQQLQLKLNAKSRIIPIDQGVLFCGFRIFADKILLSTRNKKSVHRMIRHFRKTGDKAAFLTSLTAWHAHTKHANSHRYQTKIYQSIAAEFFDLVVKCPHHTEFQPDCADCQAVESDKAHIWEILKEFLSDGKEVDLQEIKN
jgi:hypothetical protein